MLTDRNEASSNNHIPARVIQQIPNILVAILSTHTYTDRSYGHKWDEEDATLEAWHRAGVIRRVFDYLDPGDAL